MVGGLGQGQEVSPGGLGQGWIFSVMSMFAAGRVQHSSGFL